MELVFMGTGTSTGVPMIGCECEVCRSSDPRDQRTRSSLLVRTEACTVLIDTAVELRLQALRVGLRRVDAVLFTHTHGDHVYGFDDIRQFNLHQGRPIPIYAVRRDLDQLTRLFSYAFPPAEGAARVGFVPQVYPVAIEGPFSVGDLQVTPVPIWHGADQIVGFRFGPAAYLTDCSGIPEASLPLLQGLEVLILGALGERPHPKHFSIDQALAAVAELRPARAYLTHLSHRVAHAATEERLPPHVRLAYDGLRVRVNTRP